MKVTAKITADGMGERWTADFPRIDTDKCFPTCDGKLTADPDECYLALARSPLVQGVKHDERFLNQVVASWARYVDSWKDENCIRDDADGYERTMRRVEHRRDRDMQTYVRAVWHEHKGVGVSLSIRIGNDGSVVQRRDYERIFAWKLVEAAVLVNEDLVERGLPKIEIDAETMELYAEFKAWCAERDAERKLKEKNEGRFLCPHYRNGYCSADRDGNPPDFGCVCYAQGRCVEANDLKKENKEVK